MILTCAQAKELGICRSTLLSSAFVRLFNGVYATAGVVLDRDTWVAAARLIVPEDACLTSLSALQHHGLDYGAVLPLRFTTRHKTRGPRPGLTLHQRSEVIEGGIDEPLQAYVEFCRESSLDEAVIVGDRMIHCGLVTPDDMLALRRSPVTAVRRAARLVRVGSESPQGARARPAIALAGLPTPACNVDVTRDDGTIVARADMLIAEYKLVLEYDGEQHRTDPAQVLRDKQRLPDLRKLGYIVVTVEKSDLRDPWVTVMQVYDALRQRGYTRRPPLPNIGWRDLFGISRRVASIS